MRLGKLDLPAIRERFPEFFSGPEPWPSRLGYGVVFLLVFKPLGWIEEAGGLLGFALGAAVGAALTLWAIG